MRPVRLLGFLLQAAGLLVAGTSGLCSLYTIGAFIANFQSLSSSRVGLGNLISFAIVFLSIGVFSFFCGIVTLQVGRNIAKSTKKSRSLR
jgi:hypothetical protein